MNILEKIREQIHGEPVLFDYHCYHKPWTTQELNQLMMAEYTEQIKDLALQMNRSYNSVVIKYLEVREMMDKTLAFDVKLWAGQQQESDMYQFDGDWNRDEFTKGINVFTMKVGEILEVLIRIVDPELRDNIPPNLGNQWAHYIGVSPDGGGGGLFGGSRVTALELGHSEVDPDMWYFMRFIANKAGPIQIGMAVRQDDDVSINKTMYVTIEE